MNNSTTTTTEMDWKWKAEDVAHELGVSRDWVYDKAKDGTLPSKKIGRFLRFSPAAIRKWVESQPSAAEVP